MIGRLLCRFGFHNYGTWEVAQFIYEIAGKSQPIKAFHEIRECQRCRHMDEAPTSGVWN